MGFNIEFSQVLFSFQKPFLSWTGFFSISRNLCGYTPLPLFSPPHKPQSKKRKYPKRCPYREQHQQVIREFVQQVPQRIPGKLNPIDTGQWRAILREIRFR